MLDYHKFVGEIDHNNSEFIKRIDKLSVNGFLVSLANQVPSINGHNEPSVKTISSDGKINYQFNFIVLAKQTTPSGKVRTYCWI